MTIFTAFGLVLTGSTIGMIRGVLRRLRSDSLSSSHGHLGSESSTRGTPERGRWACLRNSSVAANGERE